MALPAACPCVEAGGLSSGNLQCIRCGCLGYRCCYLILEPCQACGQVMIFLVRWVQLLLQWACAEQATEIILSSHLNYVHERNQRANWHREDRRRSSNNFTSFQRTHRLCRRSAALTVLLLKYLIIFVIPEDAPHLCHSPVFHVYVPPCLLPCQFSLIKLGCKLH